MLRALVSQLSSQLNDNNVRLSRLYDRYRNATPPDPDLEDCLHQLVQAFTHSQPGLYLLVTSRKETDIRDALYDDLYTSLDEIVSMKNESVDSDRASFISGCIKYSRKLYKWADYYSQIESALAKGSKGVSQWVECQFQALSSCRSKHQLDKALVSLLQVSEQDARRILTLRCCAKRPLTVSELIDVNAVEIGDNPRLNPDSRLLGEDEICAVCPGLVEVDTRPKGDTTVRIAYFSVQEYLESERILQQSAAMFSVTRPKADAEVTSICLTYLLEPALSRKSIAKYPFALYTANTWHRHFHDAGEVNAQGGDYGSALQAASGRGHEQIVKLLEKGADVNVLQAASDRGQEQIVI
ncbi:hypothetical protein OIDMADRAFT_34784 [Oidiodendron maius Zn]|uniref:GPI inositol-deacylase winged helix domain-containing protein n=1 Tax=Oidiodendron maius (strain Zn) TaxID=913774 RepID=A0A0C3GU03_OIDMZ|nr:hypothetical protein OIDMADRAFT_34784 [Oidiodendron maius Zn]